MQRNHWLYRTHTVQYYAHQGSLPKVMRRIVATVYKDIAPLLTGTKIKGGI